MFIGVHWHYLTQQFSTEVSYSIPIFTQFPKSLGQATSPHGPWFLKLYTRPWSSCHGQVSLPDLHFTVFAWIAPWRTEVLRKRWSEDFRLDRYRHLAVSPAGAARAAFELEDPADSYFKTEDAEVPPAWVSRCATISDWMSEKKLVHDS